MAPRQPTSHAHGMSRRRFIGLGLRTVGMASILSSGLVTNAHAARAAPLRSAPELGTVNPHDSIERAYPFLNAMMDAYAQGATLRLAQSYADSSGLFSTAFTYDNALTIIAYLARHKGEDVNRAMLLGDSILYAQQHDPGYNDGRLRQAYNVGPYTFYDGVYQPDGFVRSDGFANIGWQFGFVGSAVGDLAWAGLALAQLASYTGSPRYLAGALRLGRWIFDTTYATNGPGGYNFGVDGGNHLLTFKSTEHNIDVYGLFTMLAHLTRDTEWFNRAAHARDFVKAMWNDAGGFFWTGTTPDGVTINYYPIPEDVQTWSYLALLDPTYAGAIDWAKANLATTDTAQAPNSSLTGDQAFSGVTFSNASLAATSPSDPDAVWFEGTAHLAAALLERNAPLDRTAVKFYLDNIRLAQAQLGQGQTAGGHPLPPAAGVVAASSPLNTGFGFSYFPNLHIGATSWYLMAAQATNPYQLRRGREQTDD